MARVVVAVDNRTKKDYTSVGHKTNTWQEFTCGWGASFINITVTYPIYKVMFRQVGIRLVNFCLPKIISTIF